MPTPSTASAVSSSTRFALWVLSLALLAPASALAAGGTPGEGEAAGTAAAQRSSHSSHGATAHAPHDAAHTRHEAGTATQERTATAAGGQDAAAATEIHVYKTPTCGCCGKWIEHLEAAGFRVQATDLRDLEELKAMNGVPRTLSSCHTALVEGYVIEGHVPASDVARLLAERPKVSGLAVPGMPMGSPGMEHPDRSRHEAYDVVSFGADGVEIFNSHAAH